MKEEISITLATPVQYHSHGEVREARFVSLFPPKVNHRKYTRKIKKEFFKAINYFREQGQDETTQQVDQSFDPENDSLPGDQIMTMLYMADCDVDKLDDTFLSLFAQEGVCHLDGEVQVTSAVLYNLSDDDMERLMGEYMANFIISALTNNLTQS